MHEYRTPEACEWQGATLTMSKHPTDLELMLPVRNGSFQQYESHTQLRGHEFFPERYRIDCDQPVVQGRLFRRGEFEGGGSPTS